MATPQGRSLHTPEQVSPNQEPPDSRPGVLTTTLLRDSRGTVAEAAQAASAACTVLPGQSVYSLSSRGPARGRVTPSAGTANASHSAYSGPESAGRPRMKLSDDLD